MAHGRARHDPGPRPAEVDVNPDPALRSQSLVDPHPGTLVLHSGYTVLCTAEDGSIEPAGSQGLFHFDTRLLARHRWSINGQAPQLVSGAVLADDRWTGVLRAQIPGGSAAGPRLPQDAHVLVVDRRVGDGLHESVTLRNDSLLPAEVELRLHVDADFRDVSRLGGDGDLGTIVRTVDDDDGRPTLLFRFEATRNGTSLERGVRVRPDGDEADMTAAENGVTIRVSLPPGGSWRGAVSYDTLVDGRWRCPPTRSPRVREEIHRSWAANRTRLELLDPLMASAFERAADDLFGLRNWELEAELPIDGNAGWILNAGVPSFTGYFGRDAITAGWQSAMLGVDALRGALEWAARTQASVDDPWRDAEPGRMVHEMRRGPLAELGIVPHHAYYGSQTTPSMFVVALSELWHWTGEEAMLRRHLDAALRTFDWAERYGDRDGDGFLEYTKRSPAGLKNQGWKDSDEAIRDEHGSLVENPIATVEEQAFHLLATERMAEILIALGDDDRAGEFLRKARSLRTRWDEAFWMPEGGYYALALGPDKRPIRTIASNPGHALGTGSVPRDKARLVADRLLSPELFSGWGVRTLSARHPAYNPLAYHLGTVWPVENATFALGLRRYGFDEHLDRLAAGMFEAASLMAGTRLPEALAGYSREEIPLPVAYPASNSPQAWSASAVIQLVQALLGLYPFAPLHVLAVIRPRLPSSVPTVVLRDLRVGKARVSLRFTRQADGTAHHEVIDQEGELFVVSAPPPQDVEDDLTAEDRLTLWTIRHAPLRLARALRVALGLER